MSIIETISAGELGLAGCWKVIDPRMPAGGRQYIVTWMADG
jgi:hypothetical protein